MLIRILDFTTNWSPIVQTAVDRWNAALAFRGITLRYERQLPGLPGACDLGAGVVHVCDAMPRTGAAMAESWVCSSVWTGSYVRFYTPPPASDFAIAEAVHEFGHVVMLNDNGTGTPTVMTPVPHLAYPSTWDAMNALPGYPLPEPQPPAPSPPAPVRPDKKKKKNKKKRH